MFDATKAVLDTEVTPSQNSQEITMPNSSVETHRDAQCEYLLHRIATLILTALTFYAVNGSAKTAFSAEKPSVPNIVLILADDQGYYDLGCYGATEVKTPRIEGAFRALQLV